MIKESNVDKGTVSKKLFTQYKIHSPTLLQCSKNLLINYISLISEANYP